jgi:hypothetical protein
MKYSIVAISALAFTMISLAPAQAQNLSRLERQDALFLACMEARGFTDAAAVICYRAAYGTETTGGGGPNSVDTRIPYNDCRGREFECTYGRTGSQ